MCDKGQSLPGKRFTPLPQTMASVDIFSSVLRCCVVEHLGRRFKPPAEETRTNQQKLGSGSAKVNYEHGAACSSCKDTYRLHDCHRHLKFCPAFLLCSGGAVEVCCAGRWGLWLPAGAGWDPGGGDGVTVGCWEETQHEKSQKRVATLVAEWLQCMPQNRCFPGLTPVGDICCKSLFLSLFPPGFQNTKK